MEIEKYELGELGDVAREFAEVTEVGVLAVHGEMGGEDHLLKSFVEN